MCVCLQPGSAQLFKCERSSFHLTTEKEFWQTGTSIFQLCFTYNDTEYLIQCLAYMVHSQSMVNLIHTRKPTWNWGSSRLCPPRLLRVLQCQAYSQLLRNTMWMNESLEIILGTEGWGSDKWATAASQWLWAMLPCIPAETGFLVQELVVASSQRTQNSGLKYPARTSLVVQWLRLYTSNSGQQGSIPSQGTELPHATTKDPEGHN